MVKELIILYNSFRLLVEKQFCWILNPMKQYRPDFPPFQKSGFYGKWPFQSHVLI
jgi:hypothetical protein